MGKNTHQRMTPEWAKQTRRIARIYRVPVMMVDPDAATRWQRLRWWLIRR